ncbi:MAG TPA: hypothetical protein VNW50_12250 [Streptosporangiaceae bacterium]|nr:hypothetical protein [Streptosporangiaceae bacterium]
MITTTAATSTTAIRNPASRHRLAERAPPAVRCFCETAGGGGVPDGEAAGGGTIPEGDAGRDGALPDGDVVRAIVFCGAAASG